MREHARGAIANGLAAHGGTIAYVSTFLIYSDYTRPPIRLAALIGLHVIHVCTHDSLALGEDGPTHQPVEQVANLRAIPNPTLIRPADADKPADSSNLCTGASGNTVLTGDDPMRIDVPRDREGTPVGPDDARADRSNRVGQTHVDLP